MPRPRKGKGLFKEKLMKKYEYRVITQKGRELGIFTNFFAALNCYDENDLAFNVEFRAIELLYFDSGYKEYKKGPWSLCKT